MSTKPQPVPPKRKKTAKQQLKMAKAEPQQKGSRGFEAPGQNFEDRPPDIVVEN